MYKVSIGDTYNRWTVIGIGFTKGRRLLYPCRCVCGVKKEVESYNLRKGLSKSCGCLVIETSRERGLANTKHGLAGTSLVWAYAAMKQRCLNPKHASYSTYGGRGITIDPKWVDSFEAFLEDMQSSYLPGLTLERQDTNKGYYKDNCVWADTNTQGNNRRTSVRWEYNGQLYTAKQLAELGKVTITAMLSRLERYSAKDAVEWGIHRVALKAPLKVKLYA